MRKAITLTERLCILCGLSDWRQHAYLLRQLKQHFRLTQKIKKCNVVEADRTEKQEKKEQERLSAFQDYLELSQSHLHKIRSTLVKISSLKSDLQVQVLQQTIEEFMQHADRQIDQIQRRVLQGEVIPHEEKVFSLFQPHTEWIVKGKAGVPVELGIRVCVVEDQHQFILNHTVMQKQTDDQVCVPLIQATKDLFPELNSCSFDKGFHSPDNQKDLAEILPVVALPRKGRLSKKAQAIESSDEFKKAKDKHSAVESAINALEVHGLDVCLDHGIDGFQRYVSLAIVARNVQRIGSILIQRERKRIKRKKLKEARSRLKLA